MLETAIFNLTIFLIGLFITYLVITTAAYYVMCVIEWCQDVNDRRK
jgi:hypothetical protein